MRADTTVRGRVARGGSVDILIAAMLLMSAPSRTPATLTQESRKSSEPAEMLVTQEGFLAISSPRGWIRTDGPGLAYFVPPQKGKGQPPVWIYISSAPIGPTEETKDLKAYIDSAKAEFKQRFRNAVVQEEVPLSLRDTTHPAPVLTFRSGEKRNAIEQVVYVGETTRVLTFVLSATEQSAFERALPTFRKFASSYRGSITTTDK